MCRTDGLNYEDSEPIEERLDLVNQLYDSGNEIIIFTARGSISGRDFNELTRQQLLNWNVSYHRLILGKPAADFYIDDKAIFSEHFFEQFRNIDGNL